ncbi:MAG: hypothetical protein JHC98_09745 [Thermoleophilaceae bacterium]|nr:hypothetical protein [Thermoleophilaceae bacterium]
MKTALIATLFASLILAASASANDYVVYSCKTPSGTPAPTDGWSPTGSANYPWFADDCSKGGALRAGMGGPAQVSPSSRLGWSFDSGPATIRGYAIDRGGRISGTGWGVSMHLFDADFENNPYTGHAINYCVVYYSCSGFSGLLTRTAAEVPAGSRHWFLTMACAGYEGEACVHSESEPNFGELFVRSAAFTLDDSEQPSVSGVGGSLLADGASFGAVTFLATDEISGIARATIEADGAELVSVVPNANGGRCQRVGQSGTAPDYLHVRPCPSRQQVELTLPRDSLSNGEHTIRVRVHDAAGNSVIAFGPRRIQVTGSRLTGLAAAHFALDGPTSIVAKYGRRVRISGRLLANTGEPIANARIESTDESSAASRARISRVVHTDLDGRFEMTAKATANRRWTLHHVDSGAKLTGKLKVRSRIALRAVRTRIRPRGRMRLTGRIPSERARHGASVAIKVKNGRRWRTVAVVRSTRTGRFKFNYRFTRTSHASLRFRAVALKSSDLTVSATPSKALRIRVG